MIQMWCNKLSKTITIGFSLILFTSQSHSQQCDLNRKDIIAVFKMCSATATNCITTRETFRVFGRNLLHRDPNDTGGVPYVLGQTVTLSLNELGEFAPTVPGWETP